MRSAMLPTTCRRCNRPMKIINPNAPEVISARVGPLEPIIAEARCLCEWCECESLSSPAGRGQGEGESHV
jgi:hypothetical protein